MGVFMRTQLVADRYPDYTALIPKPGSPTTVNVEAEALARVARQAHLFGRDNASIVELEAGAGTLVVRSKSAEMGESESVIPAETMGESIGISFNAKYLGEAMAAFAGQVVRMDFTKPTRPVLMTIEGGRASEFLHVIMPMHPPR